MYNKNKRTKWRIGGHSRFRIISKIFKKYNNQLKPLKSIFHTHRVSKLISENQLTRRILAYQLKKTLVTKQSKLLGERTALSITPIVFLTG